ARSGGAPTSVAALRALRAGSARRRNHAGWGGPGARHCRLGRPAVSRSAARHTALYDHGHSLLRLGSPRAGPDARVGARGDLAPRARELGVGVQELIFLAHILNHVDMVRAIWHFTYAAQCLMTRRRSLVSTTRASPIAWPHSRRARARLRMCVPGSTACTRS